MPSPETERARDLRNNATRVERRVWSALRGRQIERYNFRRQVPIGPYVADFACLSARPVVEIDGEGHEEIADRRKDHHLKARGFRVVCIPAADIDASLDRALKVISWRCPPAPPRPAGRMSRSQSEPDRRGLTRGSFHPAELG